MFDGQGNYQKKKTFDASPADMARKQINIVPVLKKKKEITKNY